MTQTYRISLSKQDLTNIKNALTIYSNKLWDEPNNRPGQSGYPNIKSIQSLILNFQLLLLGEKLTGRRKKFHPYKERIEGLKS